MKHRRTITETIEITFEYDDEHFSYVDENSVDYTAKVMCIRPSRSIEEGVKLLSVCDTEHDGYWLINNN